MLQTPGVLIGNCSFGKPIVRQFLSVAVSVPALEEESRDNTIISQIWAQYSTNLFFILTTKACVKSTSYIVVFLMELTIDN